MAKAWKVIGTIVIILVVIGAISIGVGILTGGSLNRMIESFFGSYEAFEYVRDNLGQMIIEAIG